eukprot:TCALIF_06493-PA protein Name:"Similar to G3BP2 Ras GTPase-activating protein-binding protein 2 (Pongo abelii)" AED:0.24 eAED:0.24 QI:0/0.75/0.4/1/1/1/5/0/677
MLNPTLCQDRERELEDFVVLICPPRLACRSYRLSVSRVIMVMDRPIAQVSSTAPPASAVAPSLLASEPTGAGQPASGQPTSMTHASEPVPSPQSVGREFVRQYYTLLNQAPEHLHRFYSHNSSFVHGGLESHEAVKGQHQIHQRIQELNFQDCHAKIRQVDAYSTLDDGVVVQVSGELSNNGQPMRRFMQTFVLAPQSRKKYYVHNDIFRYQDEVYGDEDSSSPPSEVNVEGTYQNSVSAMANQPSQEEVAPVPREMVASVATTNGHVHHAYNANVDKNAKNMKGVPATPNAAISTQEGNFAPKQPTGPVVVSVNPAPAAQTIPSAEVPVRQAPVASIKNLQGNNANENGNNGVSSADLSPENSPQGNTAMARTTAKAHPAPTPSAPKADQPEKTAPVLQATAQVAAQPAPSQVPPSEPSGPISYASLVKAGQSVGAKQSDPVVTGKPPPAVTATPVLKQDPKEGGALPASTTTFVNKGNGGFRGGGGGGGSGGNRGGGPVAGGRGGMTQNPRERFVSSGGPESIDGSDSGPSNVSGTGGGPPNAGRGNRKRITSATNPSLMFTDAQQLFVGANQSKTTPGGARVPNFGFVVFEDERSVQECLRRKPIHLPQDNHRLNVEEKMNKFFSHRSEGGGGPNQGGGGMGGNRNYDRGSQEHLGGGGGNAGGMGRGGPGGDR